MHRTYVSRQRYSSIGSHRPRLNVGTTRPWRLGAPTSPRWRGRGDGPPPIPLRATGEGEIRVSDFVGDRASARGRTPWTRLPDPGERGRPVRLADDASGYIDGQ